MVRPPNNNSYIISIINNTENLMKTLHYKVIYTLQGKKVNTGYEVGKSKAINLVKFITSLGAEDIQVFMSPTGSRRIQSNITHHNVWQNLIK